jgi:phage major head subunit gpT-like protein
VFNNLDPTPKQLFDLQVAVSMLFQRGIEQAEQWWTQIATEVTSDTTKNIYPWTELIPDFREWTGERVVHTPVVRFQELVNKPFEDTIGMPVETMADDTLRLYKPQVEMMGEAASNLWNRVTVDTIKRALTDTVYDGQFFFDTDHPKNPESPGAGTYSNRITPALTLTSFRAARTQMRGFRQPNGRDLRIRPNLLVTGTALEDKAIDIVKADLVEVGTAGAAVTNVVKNTIDHLVIPELDEISATAWMLLDTKKRVKPFLVQKRKEPVVVVRANPTDDNVFWKNKVIVGGDARGAGGFGMWQTALWSSGTT